MAKRKYLSELIGDDMEHWGRRKIIIQAPTGVGKTSFIIRAILSCCKRRKEKLLILCNRRLLRQQYWYEMVRAFNTYEELDATVGIRSYQELAEQLKKGAEPEGLLEGYDVICLDEFHFFYADSDFNGYGTYVLLQALLIAGMSKQMVFLSATAECAVPLVREALLRANRYLKRKYPVPSSALGETYDSFRRDKRAYFEKSEYLEFRDYNYDWMADYDYLRCIQVPDWQTICGIAAEAKGKTIIFVDNKELAAEMEAMIKQRVSFKKNGIKVLNADNLDTYENDEVVRQLVMANKLLPKVLITTSVLDNGVSIHDSEVENLVIMTESRVSFLQMLGRVRKERVSERIALYFVKQLPEYYEQREQMGAEMKRIIEELEAILSNKDEMRLIQQVWDSDDEKASKNVRKLTVFLQENVDFFDEKYNASFAYREEHAFLHINEYAKKKILDTYRLEAECHALSRRSETAVAVMQMEWIGKEESELEVFSSTYRAERERQLVSDLKTIRNFTKQQLSHKKEDLSKKYRKDFFADIVTKNGSFSDEKLAAILKSRGLKLKKEKGGDGREQYTVTEDDSSSEGRKEEC